MHKCWCFCFFLFFPPKLGVWHNTFLGCCRCCLLFFFYLCKWHNTLLLCSRWWKSLTFLVWWKKVSLCLAWWENLEKSIINMLSLSLQRVNVYDETVLNMCLGDGSVKWEQKVEEKHSENLFDHLFIGATAQHCKVGHVAKGLIICPFTAQPAEWDPIVRSVQCVFGQVEEDSNRIFPTVRGDTEGFCFCFFPDYVENRYACAAAFPEGLTDGNWSR